MPGRTKKQAEAAEEDASMQDVNETVANDTEMQEEAQEAPEVEEEEFEEIEQQRVKIVWYHTVNFGGNANRNAASRLNRPSGVIWVFGWGTHTWKRTALHYHEEVSTSPHKT